MAEMFIQFIFPTPPWGILSREFKNCKLKVLDNEFYREENMVGGEKLFSCKNKHPEGKDIIFKPNSFPILNPLILPDTYLLVEASDFNASC